MDKPVIPEGETTPSVAMPVYEAAVEGRQDFRTAYRELLPVQRAAAALCLLWRTPGVRPDSAEFGDALNALDVATCGGGRSGLARPVLEGLAYTAKPQDPAPAPDGMDHEAAARMAAVNGLDWQEQCRIEAGEDECDSSTCIAAHDEDHDPEACRMLYLRMARAALRPAHPASPAMRLTLACALIADKGGSAVVAETGNTNAWKCALRDADVAIAALASVQPAPVHYRSLPVITPAPVDAATISNRLSDLPAPVDGVEVQQVDREVFKSAGDVVYGAPYHWLHKRGLTNEDTHGEAHALWAIATVRVQAYAAGRADGTEAMMKRVRRLEAALRVARGWVINGTESAQARRDLVTVDAALDRSEDHA